MKIRICLLLLLFTWACKPKADTVASDTGKKLTHIDSTILGNWTMCASTSGEGDQQTSIMRNECVKWLFKADHRGVVGLGEVENSISQFDWEIKGNTLHIKNKIGNQFIENGTYQLTVQKAAPCERWL